MIKTIKDWNEEEVIKKQFDVLLNHHHGLTLEKLIRLWRPKSLDYHHNGYTIHFDALPGEKEQAFTLAFTKVIPRKKITRKSKLKIK